LFNMTPLIRASATTTTTNTITTTKQLMF
jgi:hypothetical protein